MKTWPRRLRKYPSFSSANTFHATAVQIFDLGNSDRKRKYPSNSDRLRKFNVKALRIPFIIYMVKNIHPQKMSIILPGNSRAEFFIFF